MPQAPAIQSPFAAYVMPAVPTAPLPCAHTCEGINFRNISVERRLRAVTPDNVVYLFYGRPAYRPSKTELSTRNLAYAPVTIVLKQHAPLTPNKIYPFDSGAFESELYKKHFHPTMTLDDFLMTGPLEVAGKLITRFYGSNNSYYGGTTNIPSPPAVEFEAVSYFNLITDPGPVEFDDRRASIEIQVQGEIILADLSVELVVLPTQYLSVPLYRQMILDHWKAEIRDYTLYHDRPNSYIAQIRAEVERFYKDKKYL